MFCQTWKQHTGWPLPFPSFKEDLTPSGSVEEKKHLDLHKIEESFFFFFLKPHKTSLLLWKGNEWEAGKSDKYPLWKQYRNFTIFSQLKPDLSKGEMSYKWLLHDFWWPWSGLFVSLIRQVKDENSCQSQRFGGSAMPSHLVFWTKLTTNHWHWSFSADGTHV